MNLRNVAAATLDVELHEFSIRNDIYSFLVVPELVPQLREGVIAIVKSKEGHFYTVKYVGPSATGIDINLTNTYKFIAGVVDTEPYERWEAQLKSMEAALTKKQRDASVDAALAALGLRRNEVKLIG